MPSKIATVATVATLAVGSMSLAACGGSAKPNHSAVKSAAYVPLTQANFSSAMAAAIKNKHSVEESTTSGGRQVSTIEFDSSASPLKLRISQPVAATKSSPAGTVVVVLIGNDLYARKTPGKTGGKWLKYHANDVNLNAITSGMGKINPADMVSGLTKGITGFKYVGPTSVGGVTVQHYQLTLKSSELAGGATSTNIGADSAVIEQVYLNGDNTLSRIELSMPGNVGDVQVAFTKWGQPLGIAAPPASQVKAAK